MTKASHSHLVVHVFDSMLPNVSIPWGPKNFVVMMLTLTTTI
jgi:hypothetical protein